MTSFESRGTARKSEHGGAARITPCSWGPSHASALLRRGRLGIACRPCPGQQWADHCRTLEAIAWEVPNLFAVAGPDSPAKFEQTAKKRLIRWAVDGTRGLAPRTDKLAIAHQAALTSPPS